MAVLDSNQMANQNNNEYKHLVSTNQSAVPLKLAKNVVSAQISVKSINPLLRYSEKKMLQTTSIWLSATTTITMIIIIILVEMLSMAQAETCRDMTSGSDKLYECPRQFMEPDSKSWCCGANTLTPRCCEWEEREKETDVLHKRSKSGLFFDNIITLFMLKLIMSAVASCLVYFVYVKVKTCCKIMMGNDDVSTTTTAVRAPRRPIRAGSNGLDSRTSNYHHTRQMLCPAQSQISNVEENAPMDECQMMINDCGIMVENGVAVGIVDSPPSYSEAISQYGPPTSTAMNFSQNVTASNRHDPSPSISSTTSNSFCSSSSPSLSLIGTNGQPNSQQHSSEPITEGSDETTAPSTPPPSYTIEVNSSATQPPYNPEFIDGQNLV